MKIWKIIMGCLSILIGVLIMDESQSMITLGRMFGANSIFMYAGHIVALSYIGIGVVALAMINKKSSNIIISILSVLAFICSFCGPKIFEDLLFFSVWAIVCGVTALICFLKNKKSNAKQEEILIGSGVVATPNTTRECPYCSSMIDSNAVFCGKCGKELDIVKYCPYCGASVNDGATFCPNCGKEVGDQLPSSSVSTPEQKHCPHCGALVNNDCLFCENCGKNLSGDDPQEPYETESDSQSKFVLPIVVGLLVLALAGGGWWYYKSSYSLKKGNVTIADNATSTDSIVSVDANSKEYIKNYLDDILPKAIKMKEQQAVKKYFTKEFADLYREVEVYDSIESADGDIGFWDSDFWTGGQDGELASIKVLEISDLTQDKATALVQYVIKFGDYDESKISHSLYLAFENGNWLIDDFNSYKNQFKNYLKSSSQSNNNSISYVGKTYKGGGNGGGMGIDMTITFLDNNKCRCVSDWYRAYPDGKALQGTYEVKNGHVIVHCTYDGIDYDFDFGVKENGRVIGFNNSDDSVEGTIGLDYMTLELSN